MIRRLLPIVLSSPLFLALFFTLHGAQAALPAEQKAPLFSEDPTDVNIAQVEADLLQNYQYSQHPFDQEIDGRFLDRYLETLDYYHNYFLQSDINEFETYRTNLHVLTLQYHDLSPCWVIFSRFMERASERINYVTNLLATTQFDFTGHDRFIINRHTLPYAKDMGEAKEFWRQELRCEYLEQLLAAQGIEFAGKISQEERQQRAARAAQNARTVTGKISFSWNKTRPLDFEHFPKALLGKDGRPSARWK